MNGFMENLLKNVIYVDFNEEIMYGSDQVNISFPCRFATVNISLCDTMALNAIADRIRYQRGYLPFRPVDGKTAMECDLNGWYNFYVELNDYAETKVSSCITFVVVNSDSEDDEEVYYIDLTEEEQRCIYARLDEQFKRLGKSCDDLLAEARQLMEEEE